MQIYIPGGPAEGKLAPRGAGLRDAVEGPCWHAKLELPARAANELGAVQNSPPHWFGLCDTWSRTHAAALLAERAKSLKEVACKRIHRDVERITRCSHSAYHYAWPPRCLPAPTNGNRPTTRSAPADSARRTSRSNALARSP